LGCLATRSTASDAERTIASEGSAGDAAGSMGGFMQPGVGDVGASAAFTSLCCFGYMVPVAVSVTLVVLWIIALVDVLQRTDAEFPSHQAGSNDRLIWVHVVLLLNGIGALVYYFLVMKPYPRRRR